jgi:hypothetical protein
MQQGGLPPSGRVRTVFEEVLAGDEFQYAETSPWARWLRAFSDFVGDLLRRWWPDLQDTDVQLISWAALALLAVASFLLLYRWAGRMKVGTKRGASGRAAASAPLDAQGWAARAREAAAAGRYREAATGVYQSTILHLDAQGRLRYRDWKTPGDYALEVTGEDALRGGFILFLTAFVELAFGPSEPDSSSFAALSARAAGLGGRA